MNYNKIVSELLGQLKEKIDSSTCELSEEEALSIMSNIGHIRLNKQQVADRYKVSPKTIDRREAAGEFPQSHKIQTTKRHWYLDELIKFEQDEQLLTD